MTHLWVRAEQRENEDLVGITPEWAKELINLFHNRVIFCGSCSNVVFESDLMSV